MGLIAYREFYLIQRAEIFFWIGLGILVLFPILHIFILFAIGKNYYPDRSVSRFLRVGFHVAAGLSWLSFAFFLIATILLIVKLFNPENTFESEDILTIALFVSVIIIVILLLTQLISGYRFVASIRQKQKEFQFLETFK